MTILDTIRTELRNAHDALDIASRAADFMAAPKQDDTEQMIARINRAGYSVIVCQCVKAFDRFYVCMYRDDQNKTTVMYPTPTAALQAAVNMVCV